MSDPTLTPWRRDVSLRAWCVPVLVAVGFGLGVLISAPVHAQDASAAHDGHAHDRVVIEAEDYAFDAPDQIPSGWTNIRYENTGDEPHLLLLARLPEGKGLEDYQVDVVAAFDYGWQQLRAGEAGLEEAMGMIEAGMAEWSAELEYMGGTGIVPEGEASEVALHLEPGTYVVECYMKTEDGEFHTMEGMLRELVVTEEPSGVSPPEADVAVTLSNAGMSVEGDLAPGRQTVEVNAEEWPPDFPFGHNLHVARAPSGEAGALLTWMNFMEIEGLAPPAPTGFLGGMNILPPGGTGYFTVDVEPGDYVLISETAAWGFDGVLREITVDP